MKSHMRRVIGLRSCDIILWVISVQSRAARVTYNVYGGNVSLYWDSHQSGIRLQIGTGICAVPTACAVATGEVN